MFCYKYITKLHHTSRIHSDALGGREGWGVGGLGVYMGGRLNDGLGLPQLEEIEALTREAEARLYMADDVHAGELAVSKHCSAGAGRAQWHFSDGAGDGRRQARKWRYHEGGNVGQL